MDAWFIKHTPTVLRGLVPVGMLCLLVIGLAACVPEEGGASQTPSAPQEASGLNTLTEAEKEVGWQLLFNGETFEGWTGLGRDTVPRGHWTIEKGAIKKVARGQVPTAPGEQPSAGGDLMTERTYRDFELFFQWKVSPAANSGVKYNVSESMSTAHEPVHAALGFEYQVIDGKGHPAIGSDDSTAMAGALYDLLPPRGRVLHPVGEWNQARIVFCGSRGEHWLNGEKILEYDLRSSRFDSLLEASKYADIDGFAEKRKGHIVLQAHGDQVWYRNLKVRCLSSPCGDRPERKPEATP